MIAIAGANTHGDLDFIGRVQYVIYSIVQPVESLTLDALPPEILRIVAQNLSFESLLNFKEVMNAHKSRVDVPEIPHYLDEVFGGGYIMRAWMVEHRVFITGGTAYKFGHRPPSPFSNFDKHHEDELTTFHVEEGESVTAVMMQLEKMGVVWDDPHDSTEDWADMYHSLRRRYQARYRRFPTYILARKRELGTLEHLVSTLGGHSINSAGLDEAMGHGVVDLSVWDHTLSYISIRDMEGCRWDGTWKLPGLEKAIELYIGKRQDSYRTECYLMNYDLQLWGTALYNRSGGVLFEDAVTGFKSDHMRERARLERQALQRLPHCKWA